MSKMLLKNIESLGTEKGTVNTTSVVSSGEPVIKSEAKATILLRNLCKWFLEH